MQSLGEEAVLGQIVEMEKIFGAPTVTKTRKHTTTNENIEDTNGHADRSRYPDHEPSGSSRP